MISKERLEKGLWWDRPWSLVKGCTKVSPACDNCWALKETHMRSFHSHQTIREDNGGLVEEGEWLGIVRYMRKNLEKPDTVKKPQVWAIWNDLLHELVPISFIQEAFDVMARNQHHFFLLLTKRAHRFAEVFSELRLSHVDNVGLGVTVESNDYIERVNQLVDVPWTGLKFVSVEPMLGYVSLPVKHPIVCEYCHKVVCDAPKDWEFAWQSYFCPECAEKINLDGGIAVVKGGAYAEGRQDPRPWKCQIDWVICGGESGSQARPTHPFWVKQIQMDCNHGNVPFFFKQWGSWTPCDLKDGMMSPHKPVPVRKLKTMSGVYPDGRMDDMLHNDPPKGYALMLKVDKKTAGREIEGKEYLELPKGLRGRKD